MADRGATTLSSGHRRSKTGDMVAHIEVLSECCSGEVTYDDGVPYCDTCKKFCEVKPKTLNVDVSDDVEGVDVLM